MTWSHRSGIASVSGVQPAALGTDHPDTLNSRNNLALAYHQAGRFPEAIALLERTLEHREVELGSDHPLVLKTHNNLAATYRDAGRLPEAIALYERTLKAREARLGPEHPDTLKSRNNLALAYEDAGRLLEAITLHEATMKTRTAKLGPTTPIRSRAAITWRPPTNRSAGFPRPRSSGARRWRDAARRSSPAARSWSVRS